MRLPFIVGDLERQVRAIAPHGAGSLELKLPPGVFRPVMEELASHYSNPDIAKAESFNIGGVVISRGKAV